MRRLSRLTQRILLRIVVGLSMVLVSCTTGAQEPFEAFDLEPPTLTYPADNPPDTAVAALGKALFHEPLLSLDSSISCASCHRPELAFADHKAVSPGVGGALSTRNSPTLYNVAFHPYFMREGGVPTLEMQVLVPLQEENEMHHNIVDAVHRLNQSDYRAYFLEVYGDTVTPYLLVRALANYERTLVHFNSPIDAFQRGAQTLTKQAYEGGQLFVGKAGCIQCHNGPLFTNFDFANNGTPIVHPQDIGRARLTNDSADNYLFMVPSLRQVALTAPYMHDGSVATLAEVVAQYNEGGAGHNYTDARLSPLNLTKSEQDALVAFLEQL